MPTSGCAVAQAPESDAALSADIRLTTYDSQWTLASVCFNLTEVHRSGSGCETKVHHRDLDQRGIWCGAWSGCDHARSIRIRNGGPDPGLAHHRAVFIPAVLARLCRRRPEDPVRISFSIHCLARPGLRSGICRGASGSYRAGHLALPDFAPAATVAADLLVSHHRRDLGLCARPAVDPIAGACDWPYTLAHSPGHRHGVYFPGIPVGLCRPSVARHRH